MSQMFDLAKSITEVYQAGMRSRQSDLIRIESLKSLLREVLFNASDKIPKDLSARIKSCLREEL